MSAIIKSGNLAELSAVRSLSPVTALATAVVSRHDEERDRLRRRIDSLETELGQRDSVIANLKAEAKRAFDEGRAQGHEDGVAQADDRQAERISLLEGALRQARSELAGGIDALERLAVLLARDCLDMILGDGAHRAELLRKIVAAQIAKIEKSALLAVEVSGEDFKNEKALAAVAKHGGLPPALVIASRDIPSGGCLMRLRLGRIEVGINQQWGALRDLLAEMALPEPAQ